MSTQKLSRVRAMVAMARRSRAMMLTLWFAVLLVAAAIDQDDGSDDMIRIHMPSDVEDLGVMAATRPWRCCDDTVCTKSNPPSCRCLDAVDRCAPACNLCERSRSDRSRQVCNDWFHGDPGPKCSRRVDADDAVGGVENAMAATMTRPWKCCDNTVCTRSIPPDCRCLDAVDRCAPTCKVCERSRTDRSRRVCSDSYHGDPGPKCSRRVGSYVAGGGGN